MRQWLVAAVLAIATGLGATAADPVLGRWVLDEAAFRDQVERFYAAAMREIPADERDQAEAFAEQAIAATVDRMAGSAVTFEADGTVMLEPAEGRPQRGNWSRDGDTIVLEPAADAEDAVAMIGTLEDDHLRLTPDQADAVGFVMRRAAE